MRITFLLPNLNLRGGVRIVRDYARALAGRGHRVTVVVPTRLQPLPLGLSALEFPFRRHRILAKNDWFGEDGFELRLVPTLHARHVPAGDIVIATAWQTAGWVAGYPVDRGVKVYYIQDVESSKDPADADGTYRLDLFRVCTSDWIRDCLAERGVTVQAVVPYGLDHALYRPADPPDRPGVGMLVSPDERKGSRVGLEALARVRETHPRLEIHLVGAFRDATHLPDGATRHGFIRPEETAEVYRRCQVWLCPSLSEGWGLPPFEAMACGCAVVTTPVGGAPYFAIEGETARVVEPGDPAALAAAILEVLDDAALRRRFRERGLEQVRPMTHATSTTALEAALETARGGASGPAPGKIGGAGTPPGISRCRR